MMKSWLRSMTRGAPLVLLVAGVVVAALAGSVGWALAGVGGAAALGLPRLLSRRQRQLEQVARISGQLDRKRLDDLQQLARAIRAVQGTPGAEAQALQLSEQLGALNAQYLEYRASLAARFDPGELTYARYVASAEQLYLATLDRLQRAEELLRGLRARDLESLKAEVRTLTRRLERAGPAGPEGTERQELTALEQRLALGEEEIVRLRDLLAGNQQALTALADAGARLARLDTGRGRVAIDADEALRELEELAGRLERYASK